MQKYLKEYIMAHPHTIATMGQMFKFVRRYKGMTQREVAAQLGVSYQQYQKYEYDLYIPTRAMRVKLSETLEIDICLINARAA